MFISKVGAVGTANNKKDKNHHWSAWSGDCDSSHHVAVGRLMMNEWVNG